MALCSDYKIVAGVRCASPSTVAESVKSAPTYAQTTYDMRFEDKPADEPHLDYIKNP